MQPSGLDFGIKGQRNDGRNAGVTMGDAKVSQGWLAEPRSRRNKERMRVSERKRGKEGEMRRRRPSIA